MENEEHIVTYTMAELKAMNARGEGRSDWAKVDALTEEELEASIDWEEEGRPRAYTARVGIPWHRQTVTIPIDRDIIAWFEHRAPWVDSQIVAVLVNYVYHNERRRAEEAEKPTHQRRAS